MLISFVSRHPEPALFWMYTLFLIPHPFLLGEMYAGKKVKSNRIKQLLQIIALTLFWLGGWGVNYPLPLPHILKI